MYCERCGRQGVPTSTKSGLATLCDDCRDHWQVRDEFGAELLRIVKIERSDPEGALQALQTARLKNRSLDREGWLDRQVRSHRAHVLAVSGKYDDALAELNALAVILSEHLHELISTRKTSALILEQLARYQEAMAEIDLALQVAEHAAPLELLSLLAACLRIAENQRLTIPSGYRRYLRTSSELWGIDIGGENLEQESDIGMLIQSTVSKEEEAHRRYSTLRKALRNMTPEDYQATLERYIQEETVGFYRDMAIRMNDSAIGNTRGDDM